MANVNIRTPRFYCDSISYRLSRGVSQDGVYDVQATSSVNNLVGIKTGLEIELFDMKPLNLVTFNTKASSTTRTDHVVVTLDVMGTTVNRHSFIAILNHNCASANAKIRVSSTDTKSEVETANLSGASALSCTEVLNGTINSSVATNIITPALDGSTIVTFPETNDRFIGVQFEGNSTFSSANDLTVGCILVGEYFDMPKSPDLNLKRSIAFDKNIIQESLGGQRYSSMISFGKQASSSSRSPFLTTTSPQQVFGGRMSYEMSFSYLDSTDVMPNDYSTHNATDDSTIEDVWNKVNGSHIPFIFTTDGESTSESDYLFARFAQDSFDMDQVAPDVFNVSMKIEEEF